MNDIELLELAANAIGLSGSCETSTAFRTIDPDGKIYYWNPLTDDGDALRLAIELEMDVDQDSDDVLVWHWIGGKYSDASFVTEPQGIDRFSATRRAIVRAAAEIGKTP